MSEQSPAGVVDVHRGEVGERAAAAVLMLDQAAAAGAGGYERVATRKRLQPCLLVGRDHVLAGMQPPSLPAALIEIEHAAGLLAEVWIAGEHPGPPVKALTCELRAQIGRPLSRWSAAELAREAVARGIIPDGALGQARGIGDVSAYRSALLKSYPFPQGENAETLVVKSVIDGSLLFSAATSSPHGDGEPVWQGGLRPEEITRAGVQATSSWRYARWSDGSQP